MMEEASSAGRVINKRRSFNLNEISSSFFKFAPAESAHLVQDDVRQYRQMIIKLENLLESSFKISPLWLTLWFFQVLKRSFKVEETHVLTLKKALKTICCSI